MAQRNTIIGTIVNIRVNENNNWVLRDAVTGMNGDTKIFLAIADRFRSSKNQRMETRYIPFQALVSEGTTICKGQLVAAENMDMWSIVDRLEKMMEYCYNGNEKDSPYWDHYYDQINELCNVVSDMYVELQDIKSQMPAKKIAFCSEDDCSQTATVWFNTAAAMLSNTDMTELLENKNIYYADEWAKKQKRLSALNRLTKQQQMFLYTEVT